MVVTDVGDMGKICRDFNLGLVVPPQDPKKLAQAMLKAIAKGKKFKKGISKNFIRPQRVYDTKVSTKLLLEKVEKLVS